MVIGGHNQLAGVRRTKVDTMKVLPCRCCRQRYLALCSYLTYYMHSTDILCLLSLSERASFGHQPTNQPINQAYPFLPCFDGPLGGEDHHHSIIPQFFRLGPLDQKCTIIPKISFYVDFKLFPSLKNKNKKTRFPNSTKGVFPKRRGISMSNHDISTSKYIRSYVALT